MASAHVRKGDTVIVIAGKERGQEGQGPARDPREGPGGRRAAQHDQEAPAAHPEAPAGRHHRARGGAPPLQRDAGGPAQRQADPVGVRSSPTARRSGSPGQSGEMHRQGVSDGRRRRRPDKARDGKAAAPQRPAASARRRPARAARAARRRRPQRRRQAAAGQVDRRDAAPAARPFPDRGDPRPHEGARLRQPVPGAAAREDRDQHGRGRGQGEREGARLRHRRPAGHHRAEAGGDAGEEVDRELQAARERRPSAAR